MFNPIHQHMMIRAHLNTASTMTEGQAKSMLLDLVESIDMKAVTSPQSVMITEEGNKGLTGSINLATSHIAYHCWDERLLLMVDVYSCCEFNEDIVTELLKGYFDIMYMSIKSIDRLTI